MTASASSKRAAAGKAKLWFGLAALVVLLAGAGVAISANANQQSNQPPLEVAVGVSLSGPQQAVGESLLRSIQLYFDEVNDAGGIGGRPIKAVPFDDEATPAGARARAPEIVASNALAVIGHLLVSTTTAASPLYQQGRIAAVTATASDLVADNPYYFSTSFTLANEGRTLAQYARNVLNYDKATLIYSNEDFGKTLSPAFSSAFSEDGELRHSILFDAAPAQLNASIERMVQELSGDRDAGIIVLGVSPNTTARDVVVNLRRRGILNPILAARGAGYDQFSTVFTQLDEEQRTPGYFTNGIYADAPLIFDSAGEQAQVFAENHRRAYGQAPDVRAALYYEVAEVVVEALKVANVQGTPESKEADRDLVRKALASFDSPDRAVHTVTGTVAFRKGSSSTYGVRVGTFVGRDFITAPIQLVPVPNPAVVDIDKEMATGNLLRLGGQYLWRQRVVYTGIDFNQISRLDQGKRTFAVDMLIWFRYADSDDVAAIELPNALDSNFNYNNPLSTRTVDGLKYRLYRTRGEFRSEFDFHDYPFDQQSLTLRLQHPRYTREQVIYVIDRLGLQPRGDDARASAFRNLESWSLKDIRYFQDSLRSTSTRGDPAAFKAVNETLYSAVNVSAVVQRRTSTFLLKSLLPLVLLILVVYVTLFFPASLLSQRLSVAISALLAGAVLLNAINNQLVDVGYTTAIEYGFYVFFGLCLFCTIATLVAERLKADKHVKASVLFEWFARAAYPAVVVGTLAWYVLRFSTRLV